MSRLEFNCTRTDELPSLNDDQTIFAPYNFQETSSSAPLSFTTTECCICVASPPSYSQRYFVVKSLPTNAPSDFSLTASKCHSDNQSPVDNFSTASSGIVLLRGCFDSFPGSFTIFLFSTSSRYTRADGSRIIESADLR